MFFCKCLNVKISPFSNDGFTKIDFPSNKIPVPAASNLHSIELIEFFKSVTPTPLNNTTIAIQHDVFINKAKIDRWTISKCINCDSYVYALDNIDNVLLINQQFIRDEQLYVEMSKNENFSMAYKVILKPIDALPNAIKTCINEDSRLKNLFSQLQDFIATDKKNTENEIRQLTMAANQRREQAEREFQMIATLVKSIDSNVSNGTVETSTKKIQSNSIMTEQRVVDASPPIMTKIVNHREGIAKHNNAIVQKQITRSIDIDDEIFELDGMQEGAENENDRYHKYSDTEEGSDMEENMIIEKRPYMQRGRSGSINIARSAPISMPQFLQHAHLREEKMTNEQHDIASSIKLLAKSIHGADAVFGELPVRPVLKYNAGGF